jgi:hypothetical protein
MAPEKSCTGFPGALGHAFFMGGFQRLFLCLAFRVETFAHGVYLRERVDGSAHPCLEALFGHSHLLGCTSLWIAKLMKKSIAGPRGVARRYKSRLLINSYARR